MVGCKTKQKKDNKVKVAQSKRVQEKERLEMENGKPKNCNICAGDEKDEMEMLLNKVELLETKMEKNESNAREKQGKDAKLAEKVQQDVRSMKRILKKSFKLAPKDQGFPKSRKAMRKTMENQQKKLREDLAGVVECCTNIGENLAKVKQEQDNLSKQLEELQIVEKLERTCGHKKDQDSESDVGDYSGGWPYSSDDESECTTQKRKEEKRCFCHNPMCREIYPHSLPGFHVSSCPFCKDNSIASV